MKVLFVDQFSEPGGAQLCLADVIAEARRRGWATFLMRPGGGLPRSIARYSNGRKSFRDMAVFASDSIRAGCAIRRAVRKYGIDLVYVNGPRVLPAASFAGAPVVFHLHSLVPAGLARTMTRGCLRATGAPVFAASEFVAAALRDAARPFRTRVVYNGVADQTFRGRSFSSCSLAIGMIGRIAPEKGHLDFVRAARQVARAAPDSKFVVYGAPLFSGSDYEAEVRRAAAGLCLEFRGWTENVSTALHGIDMLVAPSSSVESTPRVILEALSAGTPVVAYPSGGIPELVRSGQTGMLTSESNPECLAHTMLELIGDRDLMRWLAVNGRSEWERRFTRERFVSDICDSVEGFVIERARMHARQAGQQHATPAVGGIDDLV